VTDRFPAMIGLNHPAYSERIVSPIVELLTSPHLFQACRGKQFALIERDDPLGEIGIMGKQLLEAWDIHNRVNLYVLEANGAHSLH